MMGVYSVEQDGEEGGEGEAAGPLIPTAFFIAQGGRWSVVNENAEYHLGLGVVIVSGRKELVGLIGTGAIGICDFGKLFVPV